MKELQPSEKNKLKEVLREKENTIKNLNKTIVGLQISKNKFLNFQKVIQEMNATPDILEISSIALDFIIDIITYYFAELKLFNYEDSIQRGQLPEAVIGNEVVLDESILNWALDSNRTFFSSVLEEVPDDAPLVRGKHFIIIPVKSNKTTFGYLKVHPTKREDQITKDELSFLNILAEDLANSLENAFLNQRNLQMKNFYNRVINSMSFGLLTIDSKSQITYLNKNAEFLLGIKAINDPIPYTSILNLNLVRLFDELIQRTKENNLVTDYEYEHIMGEGVVIPLGFSTSLMRQTNKESEGIIFIIRDLTLTREIIKLRELDRLKSDFISAATHEFRNPLTSIMVVAEYLENLLTSKKIPKRKVKEYVYIVRDQSKSLMMLVDDLLDIARMETQGLSLFSEYIGLKKLFKECIKDLTTSAKKSSVKFQIDVPNELKVFVDKKQIKRVFINLLSNAIKYSPKGGKVFISVAEESEMTIIKIQDQGIGIESENIAKIFDKFYRVNSELTESIEGHGLGLSIVQRIVSAHKGQIEVTSEQGVGSTFKVLLPVIKLPV